MSARLIPREVYTLTEAAAYLRISPAHARDLAARGVIVHFRLTETGPRLVALDDLRALVKERTAATMAKLPMAPPTNVRRIA